MVRVVQVVQVVNEVQVVRVARVVRVVASFLMDPKQSNKVLQQVDFIR